MNELIQPEALEELSALVRKHEGMSAAYREAAGKEGEEEVVFTALANEHASIAASLRTLTTAETHRRAYATARFLNEIHCAHLAGEEMAAILEAIDAAPATAEDHLYDNAGRYDYRLYLKEYKDPATGETRWAMDFRDRGDRMVSDNALYADALYRYEEMLGILKGGVS